MVNIEHIYIQETQYNLIRFDIGDYELIRTFILNCYNELIYKDYFIIDDIETALPSILKEFGLVYGVCLDEELVAIQGVDKNQNNLVIIKTLLHNYVSEKPLVEFGWALTKKAYQKKHIGSYLCQLIEKHIGKVFNYIATVHPNNISALKMYLNNGFTGVWFGNYFNVPRIFLYKSPDEHYTYYNRDIKKIQLDTSLLTVMFQQGYILTDIEYLSDSWFYFLTKPECRIRLQY